MKPGAVRGHALYSAFCSFVRATYCSMKFNYCLVDVYIWYMIAKTSVNLWNLNTRNVLLNRRHTGANGNSPMFSNVHIHAVRNAVDKIISIILVYLLYWSSQLIKISFSHSHVISFSLFCFPYRKLLVHFYDILSLQVSQTAPSECRVLRDLWKFSSDRRGELPELTWPGSGALLLPYPWSQLKVPLLTPRRRKVAIWVEQ